MPENIPKKKSNALLYLAAVLLVVALIAYMAYQKGLIGHRPQQTQTNTEESEKNKEEKLDINSRLVRTLYNQVTYDANSCVGLWEYTGGNKNQNEFIADGGDQNVKVRLVARLMSKSSAREIEVSKVPDLEGLEKTDPTNPSEMTYFFPYEYVEGLYKQIFGIAATLDKKMYLVADPAGKLEYHYDKSTNRYYPYYKVADLTCGPVNESTRINKAIKKGKTVTIYQDATWKEEGKQNEKYKYVYKFEQEEDGLYKFVSRKVDKE